MGEKVERRKFPRVRDENISVKLSGEGFTAITQSLDVSASGIYCKVDRRIPLMTRVQVLLSVPGKGKTSASSTMNIEGVVVREHPVKKDGALQHYDIAIFFSALLPKERKRLVQYINRKLEK
ncbi:MAG: PilZ domain-containing protein [Candidatus Omnitrophica bacterium]|nr:PilZ domain-containing protein [Candidatus Omnitrophota bacterium]